MVVGAVVLLLGAYVGACFALSGQVPRGTTVAGVSIGGKSGADARKALEARAAELGETPLTVAAEGQQAQLVPVDSGLGIDTRATVDGLTGPHLTDPGHLWSHVVGGGTVEPVTTVDSDALATAISALGEQLVTAPPPVDAAVTFVDGKAQVTDSSDGQGLDEAAAAQVLASQWWSADGPLTLTIVPQKPQITTAQAEQAVRDQADPLLAGPVTVVVGDTHAKLTVDQMTTGATFVPKDGTLTLVLDGPGLASRLVAQVPALTDTAAAHFEFDASGQPVVVAGVAGKSVDPTALAAAVVAATTTTDRTATVDLVDTDPEQSRADLEGLGVKEVVGEYWTPLTAEPRRTKNITNGASLINGTLVRPGETFSLGETISPIDASNGFIEAGVINNGMHTDGMGGGLSQVSTTTFNAAFESGMELGPPTGSAGAWHKPHSEWFNRYPEGREATISYPGLDMKWQNNTPYGALVKAWIEPTCDKGSYGCLHVQIWSTKYWTVESETFPRQHVVSPSTEHKSGANCVPSSAGNSGFLSTGVRRIYLDGELKGEWTWSWTYSPSNKIVCDG